jgi:hypothetical protein
MHGHSAVRSELSRAGLLSRPNRVFGALLLFVAALGWFQPAGGGLTNAV